MKAITGRVVNAKTGEPVFNAHVVFTDEKGNPYSPVTGTVTDPDGNYSLQTLGGVYLKATHVQFKSMVKPVNMSNFGSGGAYTQVINFALQPNAVNLPEVVIKPIKNFYNKNKLLTYAGLTALFGYFVFGRNTNKPKSKK